MGEIGHQHIQAPLATAISPLAISPSTWIKWGLTTTPGTCTATEMIPTIEMILATEMTPNHHRSDPHHRNDTYSQSNWSRYKFSEPWLKWTWDFAIYSKFFIYSCKHDSKQRKILLKNKSTLRKTISYAKDDLCTHKMITRAKLCRAMSQRKA